jgi:hypothetical protein
MARANPCRILALSELTGKSPNVSSDGCVSVPSGFVIAGQRILTNAHVVANQTFVLVRKHGTSTKYRAEVEAVGHECDLAVLKVPNEDFWEGMDPLEFGEIPQLQEQVAVVGYPQGGERHWSVPLVIDFQVACRAGCVRKRAGPKASSQSDSDTVGKPTVSCQVVLPVLAAWSEHHHRPATASNLYSCAVAYRPMV